MATTMAVKTVKMVTAATMMAGAFHLRAKMAAAVATASVNEVW
jgi:hypothetical protein